MSKRWIGRSLAWLITLTIAYGLYYNAYLRNRVYNNCDDYSCQLQPLSHTLYYHYEYKLVGTYTSLNGDSLICMTRKSELYCMSLRDCEYPKVAKPCDHIHIQHNPVKALRVSSASNPLDTATYPYSDARFYFAQDHQSILRVLNTAKFGCE